MVWELGTERKLMEVFSAVHRVTAYDLSRDWRWLVGATNSYMTGLWQQQE